MMKNFKLFSLLAVMVVAFSAIFLACCSKNSDDENQQLNTITNTSGTFEINNAFFSDAGDSYKISLYTNSGNNNVTFVYPKSKVGQSLAASELGAWSFKSNDLSVDGKLQTLATGSYITVNSLADGQISLVYNLYQTRKSGDVHVYGNYRGAIKQLPLL